MNFVQRGYKIYRKEKLLLAKMINDIIIMNYVN